MLFGCFDAFDYSARSILPDILDKLKDDPAVSHEEFKVRYSLLTLWRRGGASSERIKRCGGF